MATYEIEPGWVLTDEHSACAPGGAVVLIHANGVVQPSDHSGRPAEQVAAWAFVLMRTEQLDETDERVALANAYLRQWREGPQLSVMAAFLGATTLAQL